VYVTSNCEEVELFLNGKSLGRGAISDQFLFTFSNIAWEAGEVRAVAYHKGQPIASEAKHTIGPPIAVKLTPILGPTGLQADGSDVALVDVEVMDAKGERCPTFQQRVEFDMSGPGIWRGGYNSGKTNSINNSFLDVECGINRVSIRSTLVPGQIILKARCGELKPASITLNSQPMKMDNGSTAMLPPHPPLPPLTKKVSEPSFMSVMEMNSQHGGGRFIKVFSYSGPTSAVTVQEEVKDGAKVYADRDFLFRALPEPLKGSDWIQAANADKVYSAVDLMDLAAQADAMVYVAHDDRLPRPDWLQRQFKPTELSVSVNSAPMTLFERRVRAGESLTLGSNTENRALKVCNMYVVFVKGLAAYHAERGDGLRQ
jgi:beta-galactosidase